MKKIGLVIMSLLLVISISGCKKKDNTNFRVKIASGIQEIKINNETPFATLDILDDVTVETRMGINKNFVNDYAIVVSLYSYSDMVAVIKKDNKNVDYAIKALDLYIEGGLEQYKDYTEEDEFGKKMYEKFSNPLKEEYKGYQIYIISDDNTKVLNEVKKLMK